MGLKDTQRWPDFGQQPTVSLVCHGLGVLCKNHIENANSLYFKDDNSTPLACNMLRLRILKWNFLKHCYFPLSAVGQLAPLPLVLHVHHSRVFISQGRLRDPRLEPQHPGTPLAMTISLNSQRKSFSTRILPNWMVKAMFIHEIKFSKHSISFNCPNNPLQKDYRYTVYVCVSLQLRQPRDPALKI